MTPILHILSGGICTDSAITNFFLDSDSEKISKISR